MSKSLFSPEPLRQAYQLFHDPGAFGVVVLVFDLKGGRYVSTMMMSALFSGGIGNS
jgi:hypothetical protein